MVGIINADAIDYVNQKLIDIYNKDGYLKNISDEFIFSFGPLMCMTKGFEKEVDEISKYSRLMKIMQFTAFLYRKITAGGRQGAPPSPKKSRRAEGGTLSHRRANEKYTHGVK